MFTISSRTPIGVTPATTATITVTRIEMTHGVRNFGWTLASPIGRSASRDIAKMIRVAPIISVRTTVVRPATAPAEMSVAIQSAPWNTNALARAAAGSRLLVGHHPGHDQGDRAVEDRADRERGDDADGQVALRVLGLLGRRRDDVEADVREEDERRAREDAADAERRRLDARA